MNQIKVEITNFHLIKNDKLKALKASFSVIIYPYGQKILQCTYFINGDNRWYNFPSFKIEKKKDEKNDHIPYVSYLDKDYRDKLDLAILQALKDYKPEENNDKEKSASPQRKANNVQGDPSLGW